MINFSKTKTTSSRLNSKNRISDFSEIVLGYSKQEAIEEASRCLNCKNPTCINGCPAHNNIPLFIKYIREDNLNEAYKVLRITSNMSEICSRVCDYQKQCEGACIRSKNGEPVSIGLLERYVFDNVNLKISAEPQYFLKKVAVIGSGPAGLSCAEELNLLGYDVTIFEKESIPGGLLTFGIPNYRLPYKLVEKKINSLKEKNISIQTNIQFGTDLSFKDLKKQGFAAIFVAIGLSEPKFIGIPGEHFKGVYTSNDFLKYTSIFSKKINSEIPAINIGTKVAVIGGGNSAIDAARSALRIDGVETVEIIYRRTQNDMPAAISEINDAIEEGIKINFLTNPIEILGKEDRVVAIKCIKMEQTEVGNDGRRGVKPINGSEFTRTFDSIIYAIGNGSTDLLKDYNEIEIDRWGNILINENGASNKDCSIFAAGDIVTGASTVVNAMKDGKNIAHKIDEFLKNI